MYAASAKGEALQFEVAGFWRRNMVMRDRDTGSLWQQATGEAIMGKLAGSRLEVLAAEQTTWGAWRRENPAGSVAVEPHGSPRGYIDLFPYRAMFDLWARLSFVPPGLRPLDRRLPSREEVAGLSLRGEARAYPLSLLRERRLVLDELAGLPVVIVHERDGDRVRAFSRQVGDAVVELGEEGDLLAEVEGERRWTRRGRPLGGANGVGLLPLPVARQWWLAWSELHPGTSVREA